MTCLATARWEHNLIERLLLEDAGALSESGDLVASRSVATVATMATVGASMAASEFVSEARASSATSRALALLLVLLDEVLKGHVLAFHIDGTH